MPVKPVHISAPQRLGVLLQRPLLQRRRTCGEGGPVDGGVGRNVPGYGGDGMDGSRVGGSGEEEFGVQDRVFGG